MLIVRFKGHAAPHEQLVCVELSNMSFKVSEKRLKAHIVRVSNEIKYMVLLLLSGILSKFILSTVTQDKQHLSSTTTPVIILRKKVASTVAEVVFLWELLGRTQTGVFHNKWTSYSYRG